MTTQELETVKKELAGISAFVKERMAPAFDEQKRLTEAINGLADAGKDLRRRALTSQADDEDRRVESGPYAGCDALDLVIGRSLLQAARAQGGGPGVEDWTVHLRAAMDSLTAGSGDELIPTAQASRLWQDVHLETMIASLFSRISMPTNPFDVPLQLGDVNWYPGEENVSARSSDLPTGKQTLTARELVAEVPWSLTLEEDAVIAMLPEVRRTLVRNTAEVMDDVLLNGDTSVSNNINRDNGRIGKDDPGMAQWLVGFDGLLHLPLVDNTAQANDLGGPVTAAAYNKLLKLLGKYGVRSNESVFITDPNTFLASLGLEEVETVDKLGRAATILTGQLAVVYGHPLIVSEQMRLASSNGKVHSNSAQNTAGRVLAVNTSQWRVGFRREMSIETERVLQKRQNVMVVSLRLAFAERTGRRSAAAHTALQYNVTGVT